MKNNCDSCDRVNINWAYTCVIALFLIFIIGAMALLNYFWTLEDNIDTLQARQTQLAEKCGYRWEQ